MVIVRCVLGRCVCSFTTCFFCPYECRIDKIYNFFCQHKLRGLIATPNRNIIKSRGSSVGVVFDLRDGLVSNFTRFYASFTSPTAGPVWDKGKVHPAAGHDGPEGELRYSCTLSLTAALDEGGWSTPWPDRFTSGKETSFPLYWRLVGSLGPVWTGVGSLDRTGFRFPDRAARSELL
jgi:hypothetical protein